MRLEGFLPTYSYLGTVFNNRPFDIIITVLPTEDGRSVCKYCVYVVRRLLRVRRTTSGGEYWYIVLITEDGVSITVIYLDAPEVRTVEETLQYSSTDGHHGRRDIAWNKQHIITDCSYLLWLHAVL